MTGKYSDEPSPTDEWFKQGMIVCYLDFCLASFWNEDKIATYWLHFSAKLSKFKGVRLIWMLIDGYVVFRWKPILLVAQERKQRIQSSDLQWVALHRPHLIFLGNQMRLLLKTLFLGATSTTRTTMTCLVRWIVES